MLEPLLQRTTPLLTLVTPYQFELENNERLRIFAHPDKNLHRQKNKRTSKFNTKSALSDCDMDLSKEIQSFSVESFASNASSEDLSSKNISIDSISQKKKNKHLFPVAELAFAFFLSLAGIARLNSRNLMNSIDSDADGAPKQSRLKTLKQLKRGRWTSARPQITKSIDVDRKVQELICKRISDSAFEIAASNCIIQNHTMALTLSSAYSFEYALRNFSLQTVALVWQAWLDMADKQVKEPAMEFDPKTIEDSNRSHIADPNTLVSRRKIRIVRGETLQSIAERYFHDPDISLLMAHINRGRIRDNFVDGKRVIRIKENQELELPSTDELRHFYMRRAEALAIADPLTTFVSTHANIGGQIETGTGIIAEQASSNYIITIVEHDVRSVSNVDPQLNLIVSPGPVTLT